jgi:ferredoxin-fold anticodon binding domain-containing protein
MTEQQFKDLRIGDEVTVNTVHYKVVEVYPFQQIIMVEGIARTKLIPFRYENCELVVEDELVEYLRNCNTLYTDVKARRIREIVRKEVIDGLKFPSYKHFHDFDDTNDCIYDWFTKETKRLNK